MTTSTTFKRPDADQTARRKEILIAIIGLVGVLTTGVLSNWDKMFPPPNVVKATYAGYQPTGDPQIELRYFTEITGLRDTLKQMQAGMLDHFRKQAESQWPGDTEMLGKMFKVLEEESAAQYDEIMNSYIPVASKYLSTAEIQELNKFYSTPAMRELIRKQPLINKELMPIMMVQLSRSQEKMARRLGAVVEEEKAKERQVQPAR
jgi:hypothetical protein